MICICEIIKYFCIPHHLRDFYLMLKGQIDYQLSRLELLHKIKFVFIHCVWWPMTCYISCVYYLCVYMCLYMIHVHVIMSWILPTRGG